MFRLYDTVKLRKPTEIIHADYIGAIIDVLTNGEAYTVEFIDNNGETIDDSLFCEFTEDELILFNAE